MSKTRPYFVTKFRGKIDLYTPIKVSRGADDKSTDPLWVVIHSEKDKGFWAVQVKDGEALVRAGLLDASSNGHWFRVRVIDPSEAIQCDTRYTKWPKHKKASGTRRVRRANV